MRQLPVVVFVLLAACGETTPSPDGGAAAVIDGAVIDAAPPIDTEEGHCDNVFIWCEDGKVYQAIPTPGCAAQCGDPTASWWDYVVLAEECASGCAAPDAGGGTCVECDLYPPTSYDCSAYAAFVGCAP